MHKVNLVYARFMDDFIILFNRRSLRSHLQQIIAKLMKKLGLILHPTKTSMGTISQGFSILGLVFRLLPVPQIQASQALLLAAKSKLGILVPNLARQYLRHFCAWLKGVHAEPIRSWLGSIILHKIQVIV